MKSPCHVYIIAHIENDLVCGPVKVGMTKSIGGRLSAIQTANFRPVTIAYSFKLSSRDLALKIERDVHEELKTSRLQGEWFNVSPFEALEVLCAAVFNTLQEETDEDEIQAALVESGAIDNLKIVTDFYREATA